VQLAFVYFLQFPNGKGYVGRTRCALLRRYKEHLRAAEQGSPYAVHRAIHKYGAKNTILKVLAKDLSWKDSSAVEMHWIAKLGTLKPGGYNLTTGGDGAPNLSKEARQRIAKSRRGTHLSKETRSKISKTNKGRTLSTVTRQRMSMARRGKKFTKIHCQRISKGRRISLLCCLSLALFL
jgi:group I intron endonuclease